VFSAATETGTNAVELLKTDHRTVEELFSRVRDNEDGDNSDVFARIKLELDTHAHIEEMIFYPHCLKNGNEELQKIVREGIEEHKQVKLFLAEMDEESGRQPEFKAKMQVLMEDVEHHVEEEEDELFPLAEDQFGDETLRRLGALLEAEKQRFMNSVPRAMSA
jgi:hemerythrin superfamily protein